jgi:hypothetical protein
MQQSAFFMSNTLPAMSLSLFDFNAPIGKVTLSLQLLYFTNTWD